MREAALYWTLRRFGFLCFLAFANPATAQLEDRTALFQTNDALETRLEFSFRDIKKSKNDTVYQQTQLYYRSNVSSWDSINVSLRARGKFRRENCFFTPIKIKIKKRDAKGTLFEGNKNLKMVMPCLTSSGNSDLVVKEYLCYKLYEEISPYNFNTRLLDLTLTDNRKKIPKPISLKLF
ncbi:hypothetical protein FHG64_01360 [Antarcticibacterium flavum]|uniref:Uncharacterized protein n=1 Tax=Antarcticibacterium flavum TaxID=2058175 RepID=A0A5B7WYK8_9FLAO|nr:hypothetical protein [Antarcticibacterium flavum]QCY68150.1 hypothetical protein FHG64_01360 [Antarcticibacterium flavum]